MSVQHLIVAAFVLYALVYVGRYAWRIFKGKSTGCGCGSEKGCPKGKVSDPR